jgi:hypothetical protein
MDFLEPEAQEGEGEADRVRGGRELLGEKDQPDLAEQVERPADRAADQDGGKDALCYPPQMPTSL